MNPQLEIKLRRIQKLSGALRAACTGILILTAVGVGAAFVAAVFGSHTTVRIFDQSTTMSELGQTERAVVALLCLLAGGAFAKGVYHLRRLLDNYTRREIFTGESARQIRQLGLSCIYWGVAKFVWAFTLLMGLSHVNAVTATADSIVIGAVIVIISWFTEMAAVLREEAELTI